MADKILTELFDCLSFDEQINLLTKEERDFSEYLKERREAYHKTPVSFLCELWNRHITRKEAKV